MSTWPEERIQRVVDLWNAGNSFTKIAKEVGITPNMVAGFKHRWGWKYGMEERARNQPKRPEKRAAPIKPKKAALAPVKTPPRPILKPLPAPERKPPAKLTIFDLTNHTCRWPMGHPKEKDFHFCGHHPKEGSPYCSFHHQKAYSPVRAL